MTTNEALRAVVIQLDKPAAHRDSYIQIRLTNAVITSYSLTQGIGGSGRQFPSADPVEQISLNYETIQYVYTDGKTVFKDQWTGGK